jgi:hypothetical protein
MKQTLKIQALIYLAAYLLSSFIAWDLTWLPCRVYNIAVNMGTMSIGGRIAVLLYVSASIVSAYCLHKRRGVNEDQKWDYAMVAVCCYVIIAMILMFTAINYTHQLSA